MVRFYELLPGGLLWAQAHYKRRGWRTELIPHSRGYCLTVYSPEG